jgi:hypothetical protein
MTLERTLAIGERSKKKVPPTSVDSAVKLLKESVMLERLILGAATAREEHRHALDVSKLTSEDSEQLLELLSRAGHLEDTGTG